jgi:thymidylate kinase
VTHRGRLIVFEGPDGVGKSTLAAWFVDRLVGAGEPAELKSFPGNDPGSLGRLVYDIHHRSLDFGIERMTDASKQILHIAAHIDAIECSIKPAIQAGRTIVLDRFWWSTFVYGAVGGVPRRILELMIEVEKEAWQPLLPDIAFLIRRNAPLRPEPPALWPKWMDAYIELAATEGLHYPVHTLSNDGNITEIEQHILKIDEKQKN